MDSVTKATNEAIGKDDQDVVEAVNEETAQASVVRGDELDAGVVELAQQCGIELEDA